jgi:hypothetical protein
VNPLWTDEGSKRTNGPREKGAAPVTRVSRGSPINGSFLFLSPTRLNFFAHLQQEGLSYILKQRAEGRALRETEAEEGEGASGTKKGFKNHFSKSKGGWNYRYPPDLKWPPDNISLWAKSELQYWYNLNNTFTYQNLTNNP